MQTVSKQTSPLQKDAVTMHVYDSWGREVKKYLPFVSNAIQSGDISNDGNYKSNALDQQSAFNQSLYPGENFFYSQVDQENSPLHRTLKSYPQGNSWVGSSQGTGIQYLLNTPDDNVQIWNISLTPGSLPTNGGAYQAKQLYKTIATDEKGLQVIEYKDRDDHVILKKAQLTASADGGDGSPHAGWLCTYNVYDDYGNLRFIITPKVVQAIDGSWSITQAMADELCFRYEYDLQDRVIVNKSPGAGEEWFVFDQRGRLVMSQDANLREQRKWKYFQYDNLDRSITTGLLYDPSNFNNLSFHRDAADDGISYPNTASYTIELLTQTYYDNYNWVSSKAV